ncbi:MAG: phosphoserine phosphatase SerB, partial [Desulforhopalus sp.]
MNCILTLVSSDNKKPLLEKHLKAVERCLSIKNTESRWLSPDKAADLHLMDKPVGPARIQLESLLAEDRIDFFVIANIHKRKKRLLVADMDNTMIEGETLDELAAQCGLKVQIAQITELAMRGEIDFKTALQNRVEMLKDLSERALQKTLAAIRPMPGAELLISTMRRHGAKCVLVSGGFTCFTKPIAAKLGFHANHGNTLEIRDGRLTGRVYDPILDHQAKLSFLQHYQAASGLDSTDILAIGDGANDLAMIQAAGLGVGYHPKPYLKE